MIKTYQLSSIVGIISCLSLVVYWLPFSIFQSLPKTGVYYLSIDLPNAYLLLALQVVISAYIFFPKWKGRYIQMLFVLISSLGIVIAFGSYFGFGMVLSITSGVASVLSKAE